ncbi:MAG: M23 family metallopeptidase [Chitinispirillaceae bacterium]|nr:M23 family metallopeptidase [Chitinispirillaceae bacterium]
MFKKKFNGNGKGYSLLFLSPEGKPLRSIPFNGIVFILLIVAVGCGVAALFIPSDMLRVRDDEGFKKLHLFEQNRLLQERIAAVLPLIKNGEEQIGALDRKKERVTTLMGGKKTGHVTAPKPARSYADRLQNDPEKLLREVTRWESVFLAFTSGMENGCLFDTVPVCRPVEADAAITLPFGKVNDPFSNRMKWHYGIDYAAPPGTGVIATAVGQVVRVENSTDWGRRVIIRHGRGMSTRYAHLASVAVRQGQKVERGTVIGTIGSSGLASGPHVHYELWHNDRPVDPERYYFPFADAGAAARLRGN